GVPYRFFGFDSAISEVVNYAKKVDEWMRAEGRAQIARHLGIAAPAAGAPMQASVALQHAAIAPIQATVAAPIHTSATPTHASATTGQAAQAAAPVQVTAH
ncbi:MAG: hypothetical protein ABWZ88_06950, partial [Variovorax sp.]